MDLWGAAEAASPEGVQVEDGKLKQLHIDEKKVSTAVAQAERLADIEIVTLYVAQSDAYTGARWRLALVCFFTVSVILWVVWENLSVDLFLLIQLLIIIPCYGVSFIPGLLPHFLRKAEVQEEVEQRAVQAFFQLGLNKAHHGRGLLIMVSELEKMVEILPGRGLSEKISTSSWDKVVVEMLPKLKDGLVSEAFVGAVHRCSEMAAEYFPKSANSPNQFPDHLQS